MVSFVVYALRNWPAQRSAPGLALRNRRPIHLGAQAQGCRGGPQPMGERIGRMGILTLRAGVAQDRRRLCWPGFSEPQKVFRLDRVDGSLAKV